MTKQHPAMHLQVRQSRLLDNWQPLLQPGLPSLLLHPSILLHTVQLQFSTPCGSKWNFSLSLPWIELPDPHPFLVPAGFLQNSVENPQTTVSPASLVAPLPFHRFLSKSLLHRSRLPPRIAPAVQSTSGEGFHNLLP